MPALRKLRSLLPERRFQAASGELSPRPVAMAHKVCRKSRSSEQRRMESTTTSCLFTN